MLSELELMVVDSCVVHNFNARITEIMMAIESYTEKIIKGNWPDRSDVQGFITKLDFFHFNFDSIYFERLNIREINPLKKEQEAWKGLSPIIKQYLRNMEEYIKNYHPKEMNGSDVKILLINLNKGLDLVNTWLIIARCFKQKHERMSDPQIAYAEKMVENHFYCLK